MKLGFDELVSNVYNQWLSADLVELETPVLPTCLPKANRYVLNGIYSVQMNSIFDSSVSALSQLQKICNSENSNNEVNEEDPKKPWDREKGNRLLVMELNDGVTTVRAMEYQPIPQLKVDLAPGTKVQLSGRIECRKGMLMLTAENIKILTGYVTRLREQNCQKKFLENRLSAYGDVQKALNNNAGSSGLRRNTTNNVDPPVWIPPPQQTGQNLPNLPTTSTSNKDEIQSQTTRKSQAKVSNILDDDDDDVIFLEASQNVNEDDDVVLLQAAEELNFDAPRPSRSICSPKKPVSVLTPTTSHSYQPPRKKEKPLEREDNFDGFIDEWDEYPGENGDFLISGSPPGFEAESSAAAHVVDTKPLLGDVIGRVSSRSGNYEIDVVYDPTNGVDLRFRGARPSNQVSRDDVQLTYLCDLSSNNSLSRIFVVKGAILHTVTHLHITNDQRWSFSAKITDGTDEIECQVSDEVLTELIGMTGAEATAVRQSRLDSAKEKARESVKKAASFIQSFNGLMHIETKPKSIPVVRKMKTLDQSDLKKLEKFYLPH